MDPIFWAIWTIVAVVICGAGLNSFSDAVKLPEAPEIDVVKLAMSWADEAKRARGEAA